MKKIVFSLLIVLAVVATSCNQGAKTNSDSNAGPERSGPGSFNADEMVDRQLTQLKDNLDLSADQEKELREIFVANIEDMKEMREKSGGNREGMREQMQAIRAEQNNKIKTVLSDEQWAKFETLEQDRRSRRGQGGEGRQGGQGRPE